jgi:PAS domain S-box-containing protein
MRLIFREDSMSQADLYFTVTPIFRPFASMALRDTVSPPSPHRPHPAEASWHPYLVPLLPFALGTVLLAAIATFWFRPTLDRIVVEQHKRQTRELVRTVWSIAQDLHTQAETGKLSHTQARHQFLDHVVALRFGETMEDYFWVHDLDGNLLAHPYSGPRDLRVYRDSTGLLVVPEMNQIVREAGEGFLSYGWPRNASDGAEARKTSYVRLFEPWDWVVGAGFYEDEALSQIAALRTTGWQIIFGVGGLLALLALGTTHFHLRSVRRLSAAEEAIRANERRLRNRTERIEAGVAIFEGERFAYANPQLLQILGLDDPAADQGNTLRRHLQILFAEARQQAARDSNGTAGCWMTIGGGQERFLVPEKVFYEGQDESYITVRDRTRDQLRAEELARLSRIVEESPVSILITDLNGIIVYANPFSAEVSGYHPGEVVGRTPAILKSDRMPASVYTELWHTIRAGKVWRGELLNRRKDGEAFWEAAVIAPLHDADGTVTHYFSLKVDITEQKRLAEDLHQAKERAEESDRLKTSFLANISHEIRTPLNAITGFTDLFAVELASRPDLRPLFKDVEDNVRTLLKVVDSLLEASSLEARHAEVHVDFWNLHGLLREAVEAARAELDPASREHERVRFEFSFDSALREKVVQTDREKLLLIFSKLLTNAVKYTPEGTITVGYELIEGTLVLFVRDTGTGLSEADRARLFTPFHHGTRQHVTLHQGTGLGLYVVERLVRVMGGRIWLDPDIRDGACFRLEGLCAMSEPSPVNAPQIPGFAFSI